VLMRGGRGESAIGQIYAANTLGAIAGVLLAVHFLVPGTGVKLTLLIGAAADILLGAWLLRYSQATFRRAHAIAALFFGMLAATATARAGVLEPARLASGVFRYGNTNFNDNDVFFYRDGKTASVAVRRTGHAMVSIVTNGKADAGINLDPASLPVIDEHTMTLLAALPLLAKPDAKSFANIGFGSGLTTEVLLSHSGPRQVDTIEIEPAMVAGARAFFPRIDLAFRDPRSRIQFEDAKSFFARHGKRYDVIISEPSNPWVNGVGSLFTTEFYRDTKRYLAPGGLFVQWLHLYEFDEKLLSSILAALGENFADYEIYEVNDADIVVVAVAEGGTPRPGTLPQGEPAFLEQLKRIGVIRIEDITARSLGTKRQLAGLHKPLQAPVNSDFYPFVQLEATRARFTKSNAFAIRDLSTSALPIIEMGGGATLTYLRQPTASFVPSNRLRAQSTALELARQLMDPAADPLRSSEPALSTPLLVLKRAGALCGPEPSRLEFEQLHRAAELTLSHLAPEPRRALWVERRWLSCPPGKLSQRMRQRLDLYAAIAARDARVMHAHARALLEKGSAEGGEDWGRYLLSAAMLGAHAAGDRKEAERLWRAYGGELYANRAIPLSVAYIVNLQ